MVTGLTCAPLHLGFELSTRVSVWLAITQHYMAWNGQGFFGLLNSVKNNYLHDEAGFVLVVSIDAVGGGS